MKDSQPAGERIIDSVFSKGFLDTWLGGSGGDDLSNRLDSLKDWGMAVTQKHFERVWR